MINMTRCFQDRRLFKAVTGTTSAEFNAILPAFEGVLTTMPAERAVRQRQAGGGRHHPLPTGREQLLFILLYITCSATFDVFGWLFDVDRAQPRRWVCAYVSVLEAALGRKMVLPDRTIERVEEFLRRFPHVREVFVDGTERPIRRPTGKDARKPSDSGKNKGPRVNNGLVTTARKRVIALTDTCAGHLHDTTGANDHDLVEGIPPDVCVPVDSGVLGVPAAHPQGTFRLPEKKPNGRPLSEDANARNRTTAQRRVLVEHAMGGVKRVRAVSEVFRKAIATFADRFMLVACG